MQNKLNRSKRSLPPYIGTKSYARLRHEMVHKIIFRIQLEEFIAFSKFN